MGPNKRPERKLLFHPIPPGPPIPHAPLLKRHALTRTAEKEREKWRGELERLYPLMSCQEISRSKQPFHMLLLHDVLAAGDINLANEIKAIFKREEEEGMVPGQDPCLDNGQGQGLRSKLLLKDQPEKLEKLVKGIKKVHVLQEGELIETAIETRKRLGEEALNGGDLWLAKYFFETSLDMCLELREHSDDFREDEGLKRLIAELHCLLAFLVREAQKSAANQLADAIDHLTVCRELSRGQPWEFKQKVFGIKVKKPIAFHGLRTDETEGYEIIDGSSMTVYMIATLLEHEMLISLANQIMHSHSVPSDEDLKTAHEFADHALRLAIEVKQPVAISQALMRFGLVLRHSGAYEDAYAYFNQLRNHAAKSIDYLSEAVAHHNLGLCLIGIHRSFEALTFFLNQLDIALQYEALDVEADAMFAIGHLLLQEGHSWESEQCYLISLEQFSVLPHTKSHAQAAWVLFGISAGQTMWGRFASLCRHNETSDIIQLLAWKFSRAPLLPCRRPKYRPSLISQLYPIYEQWMQPGGALLMPPNIQQFTEFAGLNLNLLKDASFDMDEDELLDGMEYTSSSYDSSSSQKKKRSSGPKKISLPGHDPDEGHEGEGEGEEQEHEHEHDQEHDEEETEAAIESFPVNTVAEVNEGEIDMTGDEAEDGEDLSKRLSEDWLNEEANADLYDYQKVTKADLPGYHRFSLARYAKFVDLSKWPQCADPELGQVVINWDWKEEEKGLEKEEEWGGEDYDEYRWKGQEWGGEDAWEEEQEEAELRAAAEEFIEELEKQYLIYLEEEDKKEKDGEEELKGVDTETDLAGMRMEEEEGQAENEEEEEEVGEMEMEERQSEIEEEEEQIETVEEEDEGQVETVEEAEEEQVETVEKEDEGQSEIGEEEGDQLEET